jgi:small nuclear ribonucleoprotein (snRNP)-like protein
MSKIRLNNIERPLDLLNALKGNEVIIILKNGKEITGILLCFDIHINLVVLENNIPKFIKGDEVRIVT